MTNSLQNSTPGTDASPAPVKKKGVARLITPILALVAAIGIGLFGGVLIGQNTASATTAGGAAGQGQRPDGATGEMPDGATGGGGFTSGTVSAIDGDTITLELTDGSTVTITATDDTTVTTTEDSTVDALAEGDSLTVVGEADDDGNVAATSISEGATGMGGGFGGGTPPTDTETE
jgi:endonuclease YncB( thermonuclease family)